MYLRSICEISRIIADSYSEIFPGGKHNAVSAFLFLRFICPSLLHPDLYLGDVKLDGNIRGLLIQIAKNIQILSSHSTDGSEAAAERGFDPEILESYKPWIEEWVISVLVRFHFPFCHTFSKV